MRPIGVSSKSGAMGSWRVVPAQTYLLPCNVGDRKLPVSGALGWKERRMTRRHWSRSRKVKIGSALIVLGMMVWALSAALPLTAPAATWMFRSVISRDDRSG